MVERRIIPDGPDAAAAALGESAGHACVSIDRRFIRKTLALLVNPNVVGLPGHVYNGLAQMDAQAAHGAASEKYRHHPLGTGATGCGDDSAATFVMTTAERRRAESFFIQKRIR